jgi:hypothetical protein
MARPEKAPPTPPATGAGEVWEGFVLLPEGAPIPPFVTCAPAPILCQTDGSPEAEALRGEILPVQDLNEARARSSLPLYQPVGMPLQRGRIIRFQQGGSVFSVMLDFGLKEPEVRLWARPIYPRPYPIWPVRHPDQPERLIQPLFAVCKHGWNTNVAARRPTTATRALSRSICMCMITGNIVMWAR